VSSVLVSLTTDRENGPKLASRLKDAAARRYHVAMALETTSVPLKRIRIVANEGSNGRQNAAEESLVADQASIREEGGR